jgi:hypothetical protein
MKKAKVTPDSEKPVKSEIQKIHEKQERAELLFNTEALIKKPDADRELEKYELRNGTSFTIKDVKDLISAMAADYFPMFPNSNPFFSLVFRLNGWKGDPKAFVKPPACALYIKKYIYARFEGDILPYLLKMDNPLVHGYVRKYKLFQFLNDEGRKMMAGYIQDAIDVMEDPDTKSWYDFELKYTRKYKLSVQLQCVVD